jgi:N utilization substance protein B
MTSGRSRSRELALQVLFGHDACKATKLDVTALNDSEDPQAIKAFAGELVDGVLGQLDELDALITAAADNWDLGRLAVVDRNILRLAVHEMTSRPDIPTKVSINEAIELGKRFSTAQSGAFVNGILDRIRKDLGLPVDAPDSAADVIDKVTGDVTDDATNDVTDDATGEST